MATIKAVERGIERVEGFQVRFTHLDGKDVRGDLGRIPTYTKSFERMARNAMTVAEWKRTRFRPHYPGFMVEVLLKGRRGAHGAMKLGNVRDTYLA